jgi:uncharacterized protein
MYRVPTLRLFSLLKKKRNSADDSLDVSVWFATVSEGHTQHRKVSAWSAQQPGKQMDLLRLLSNPAVLGKDTVSRAQAWRVVDDLRSDERVGWLDEPPSLEAAWRAMSAKNDRSHKLWTDDYLAAFAQATNATLATLDKSCARRHTSITVDLIV